MSTNLPSIRFPEGEGSISRREFMKLLASTAVAAAGASLIPQSAAFSAPLIANNSAEILVVKGKDYRRLISEGLRLMDFPGRFLKPGGKVVIKPNAAWSRTPEQAADTNPVLISELIYACRKAGAGEIIAVENPCDNYKSAFRISGIESAVKAAGAKMIPLVETGDFTAVTIPRGKVLKFAQVGKKILEADLYINIPIAKVHKSAGLTMAMKNHMGAVQDRWFFHKNDLHQCIADISSYLRPDLTILDCTRILTTRGPKGPGDVKVLDRVIMGTDQVAIDSYGATLFGMNPGDIGYLKAAGAMGLGVTDLSAIRVKEHSISA